MKKELTTEEISFLARVQGIDVDMLLNISKLLDIYKVRKILIEYEYKERTKDKKIMKKLVVESLMKKYEASRSSIEIIVYEKQANRGKQCVRCLQYISSFRWNRNNGVCSNCMETEISNSKIDE